MAFPVWEHTCANKLMAISTQSYGHQARFDYDSNTVDHAVQLLRDRLRRQLRDFPTVMNLPEEGGSRMQYYQYCDCTRYCRDNGIQKGRRIQTCLTWKLLTQFSEGSKVQYLFAQVIFAFTSNFKKVFRKIKCSINLSYFFF